ncbi:MAG: hypothetical protein IJ188_07910 [Clostridia bacterium]|nr:hypothetical protein [Clostridia bacterium]
MAKQYQKNKKTDKHQIVLVCFGSFFRHFIKDASNPARAKFDSSSHAILCIRWGLHP